MTELDDFCRDLLEMEEQEHDLLTVSVDLRSSGDGQPVSPTLVHQMLREEARAYEAQGAAATKRFGEVRERVEAAIAGASHEGALGLAVVAADDGGMLRELRLPVPIRNSVRRGSRPWLFELERVRYLYGLPVTLALVDSHTIHLVRVTQGGARKRAAVEVPKFETAKRASAAHTGGRSPGRGQAGGGYQGGHGQSKVEQYVEEHRAMFSREAAGEVEHFLQPDDMFVLAGTDEARSSLTGHLRDDLVRRVRAVSHLPGSSLEGRAVAEMAVRLGMDERYAEAARLAAGFREQERDGRTVMLESDLLPALESGQMAALVVHEDAVDHLGVADDARVHTSPLRDEAVDGVLRKALRTGVEVAFAREPDVLGQPLGMIGRLRWS